MMIDHDDGLEENVIYYHLNNVLSPDTKICSCKEGCLVGLAEDPLWQATMIERLEEYFAPCTQKQRREMLLKYQVGDGGRFSFPYLFTSSSSSNVPDGTLTCDQHEVPLCVKATAVIFKIGTRTQQTQLLITPKHHNELARQKRLSQLLQAITIFIGKTKRKTWKDETVDRISWDDEAFSNLLQNGKGKSETKYSLQSLTSKYGLHPYTGCMVYAVAGHIKYEGLLRQLRGCHVNIPVNEQAILMYLKDLAPPASSKKWSRVNTASVRKPILAKEGKRLASKMKPQVLFRSLEGNSLQSTFLSEFGSIYRTNREEIDLSIDGLEKNCIAAIAKSKGCEINADRLTATITSYLKSRLHGVQNPHYDFKETYLASIEASNVYLGFTPLTNDGMFLQVWNKQGVGAVVYIPFGSLLILPASTMHAGGYCSRARSGNLRLHFYFYLNDVIPPTSNTNVYRDSFGPFTTNYLDCCDYKANGGVNFSNLFSKFNTEEQKHCGDREKPIKPRKRKLV